MKNTRKPHKQKVRQRTHVHQKPQPPPPMEFRCGTPEEAAEAKRIVEEYCAANGLDCTVTIHRDH